MFGPASVSPSVTHFRHVTFLLSHFFHFFLWQVADSRHVCSRLHSSYAYKIKQLKILTTKCTCLRVMINPHWEKNIWDFSISLKDCMTRLPKLALYPLSWCRLIHHWKTSIFCSNLNLYLDQFSKFKIWLLQRWPPRGKSWAALL